MQAYLVHHTHKWHWQQEQPTLQPETLALIFSLFYLLLGQQKSILWPKNCKTCWSWWCELLRLIDSQMWVDNAYIQSVFLKFGQGNTRPKKNVNENLIDIWNNFFNKNETDKTINMRAKVAKFTTIKITIWLHRSIFQRQIRPIEHYRFWITTGNSEWIGEYKMARLLTKWKSSFNNQWL